MIRAALLFAFVAFTIYGVTIALTAPGDRLNDAANTVVYPALFVLAVIVAAGRALTVRRDRLAWSVIAASLVAWCYAEVYDLVVQPDAYPSPADAGWLAFYPLLYAGLVLLVCRRARHVAGTLWVDGITASVAGAAIGSAVLLEVVLRATEGTPSEVATNLAYPVGDVLLLSAVFGIFALSGWRVERPWLVLGVGVLATAIADGIYLFQLDTYVAGSDLDILWPASALLIAAAGWVAARDEPGLRMEGRPLLAVPALCALVGIGILVIDHFSRVNVVAVALAATTLLMVLLRLAFTFRENAQLYALTRHESVTDPLTGLGNRRKLLSDLERVLGVDHPPRTLLVIFDLERLQAVQRPLRPSGRRCAPAASRRAVLRRARADRRRLPTRRRRVLRRRPPRVRRRRERRPGGVHGALRARRGIRGHRLVRVGGASRGGRRT